MLKTKIKASGITNLTDARYFAAREVEWLGFKLGNDPENDITQLAAKAIVEWVDGVKIIGEFEFPSAAEVLAANELIHFDAVQVGMFTSVVEMEKLSSLTVVKEVVVEKDFSSTKLAAHLKDYAGCCDYFLLDFTKSGIIWEDLKKGNPLALAELKGLLNEHTIILALDFDATSVAEVLETLQPFAWSLSGGAEEKVGLKSFEELDEILDQLEIIVQ